MKHKPLIRLLLRLLGVTFVLFGVRDVLMYGVYAIAFFRQTGVVNGGLPLWLYYIMQLIEPVAEIAVGLYLFCGGRWVLEQLLPPNARYCPLCGGQVDPNRTGCTDCGANLSAKTANFD